MSDLPDLPEVPDHGPRRGVREFEQVIRDFAVESVREALMIDTRTADGVPDVASLP